LQHVASFSVPSDAVRRGDFSGFPQICQPVASGPNAGWCPPFTNNQIPMNAIDSIAAAFLERVPRATSSAQFQNLTAVEQLTRDIDQLSVR
jgi:hypothetical protein